jgi:hypothetical protein
LRAVDRDVEVDGRTLLEAVEVLVGDHRAVGDDVLGGVAEGMRVLDEIEEVLAHEALGAAGRERVRPERPGLPQQLLGDLEGHAVLLQLPDATHLALEVAVDGELDGELFEGSLEVLALRKNAEKPGREGGGRRGHGTHFLGIRRGVPGSRARRR